MNRLLRISLDILVTSVVPVAGWFLLGMILDGNLINVFTLTYPIQFVIYVLKAVFATGANISRNKDNNKDAIDSGIMTGLVVGAAIFTLIIINIDKYIAFMQMDASIYREFAIYSLIQMFLQFVLKLVLSKLYYRGENKKANKICVTFNLISFMTLILMALITSNKLIITIVSMVVLFIYTIIALIKNLDSFKYSLNIFNCIKYDSVEFFSRINFIIIYLFGLSNSFQFGQEFVLAISFSTLVTDIQWDVIESILIAAKIDIVNKKFKYKEHLKNAVILVSMLIASIFILTMLLYKSYNVNLNIAMIFIAAESLNLLLYPVYIMKVCYLQLEYSALKTTINKQIANVLRTVISFVATPYCTIIGQLASMVYQVLFSEILWKKKYKKLNKNESKTSFIYNSENREVKEFV